jgi:hypothetical protein
MNLTRKKRMVGDLVYIPANTPLCREGRVIELESPMHLIIAETDALDEGSLPVNDLCSVVFGGSVWWVPARSVYTPRR